MDGLLTSFYATSDSILCCEFAEDNQTCMVYFNDSYTIKIKHDDFATDLLTVYLFHMKKLEFSNIIIF